MSGSHTEQKRVQSEAKWRLCCVCVSSHLFQLLDLVTFGVFKNEIRSTTLKYGNGTRLDDQIRIARVLSTIERATTSENNRNGFYRDELEIDTSNDPHTVVINENKLKQRIEENCLIDSPISPRANIRIHQ